MHSHNTRSRAKIIIALALLSPLLASPAFAYKTRAQAQAEIRKLSKEHLPFTRFLVIAHDPERGYYLVQKQKEFSDYQKVARAAKAARLRKMAMLVY